MNDTICAISTAMGVGAISIIRVSGNDSITIVNSIFKGKNLEEVKTHTINYGHIIYNDNIIDEVLVSVMHAPKTFTSEETVEINCHGGISTTNKILEILLIKGCRLAEPGEFTKRAFLNGKIDLLKAEGIMDLINSKTEKYRILSINQISGKVSDLIGSLRQEIVNVLANIEVNIDYPEYDDIDVIDEEKIKLPIIKIKEKVETILNESRNSKLIKEGIKTAIIGKPNVGKSSLLNKLLEEEKAIVTDIEGTTRDTVEGTLIIDGIILNIIDTAGIRKTQNIVEQIGVDKSLELISSADLILFVLDNSMKLTDEDIKIYKKLENKNKIIIVNKTDLVNNLDTSVFNNDDIVYLSTINNDGIERLKQKVKEIFNLEKLETSDLTYLSNTRSISILEECLIKIKEIEDNFNKNIPIDMLEIDIKYIWEILGRITGETYEEELIDQLFSQFCLGK